MIRTMILCVNLLCVGTVFAPWLHGEPIVIRNNFFKKSAYHERDVLKQDSQSRDNSKRMGAHDENPLMRDLQLLIDESEENAGYEASDEESLSSTVTTLSIHESPGNSKVSNLTSRLDKLIAESNSKLTTIKIVIDRKVDDFSSEESSRKESPCKEQSCKKNPEVANFLSNTLLNPIFPASEQGPIKKKKQKKVVINPLTMSPLLQEQISKLEEQVSKVAQTESVFGCCY